MTRRRSGTSYAEVSIACMLIAAAAAQMMDMHDAAMGRARDAVVRANLHAWNRALAAHLLASRGQLPADLAALRRALLVPAGEDPYRWRGSGGSGRFALRGGTMRLVDDAGRTPAGRDTRGRAYADYR